MSNDPATDESTPPPDPSPDLRSLYHTDAVRNAEDALFLAIVRSTRDAIISTPIEGKHICFIGDVPFAQEHLEQWVEKLGAIVIPDRLDQSLAEWIVIGRENIDAALIDELAKPGIRFLSQEDFLSLILFGEQATARNQDLAATYSHFGLEIARLFESNYLDEIERNEEPHASGPDVPTGGVRLPRPVPFSTQTASIGPDGRLTWPVTLVEPENQAPEPIDGLNVESELMKLGYSVARHVPLSQRQQRLDLGVQRLGLPRVVNHLSWLIRTRSNRPHLEQAVANWRDDLEWLHSRYGSR
jgi:hypothetical protein